MYQWFFRETVKWLTHRQLLTELTQIFDEDPVQAGIPHDQLPE